MTWLEQVQAGLLVIKNTQTGEQLSPERVLALSNNELIVASGDSGVTSVLLSQLTDVTPTASSLVVPAATATHVDFASMSPAVESGSIETTRYMHHLGLDSLRIGHCQIARTSGVASDLIKIPPSVRVMLEATCEASGQSSIDLSILDGIKELPILPLTTTRVFHERIYPGLPLRVPIDTSQPVQVYLDGVPVSISAAAAILSKEENYTVSYSPSAGWIVTPSQTSVQVKLILQAKSGDAWPRASGIILRTEAVA